MKLLLFLKLFKPKMLETPFTFSIMRNWGALLLISRKYRNLQLPIVLDASTKLVIKKPIPKDWNQSFLLLHGRPNHSLFSVMHMFGNCITSY
ncbi:MAG: hypothetical protein C6W54_11685 [Bacillaceae bacterium]|nr:MAG: hypothetical protein C6W54_11685 [Bacillaceae bacterium]